MKVRRRDKRARYIVLGLFVGVALFTCLARRFKGDGSVDAASLEGFDPGYIISDYQMGNYNSMDEAEIQAFLTAKNPCSNTNYEYYKALSAGGGATWHFKDGHFVCLSEELFGDGEMIGKGETAAHIIWQTAQDYQINPQVLIVLLQKETGLITDPIPNNMDYRKATGYGCPDTAPCSVEYYGFKNQIRRAAALFRTVLDGGWTNYPLGNNYVQYNPNASCGGSVVNIRSLATSALYRYTPYQPNAGALAAGYGIAYCGAYGNRNFYLFFEDWFGGITEVAEWVDMETPRYLTTKKTTMLYDLLKHDSSEVVLKDGVINYYGDKVFTDDGRMCLRTIEDKEKNIDRCVFYDDLEDTVWIFERMETPRYMQAEVQTVIMDLSTRKEVGKPKEYEYYNQKVVLPDGKMCLKIEDETSNRCVLYDNLDEMIYTIYNMETPRYLTPRGKNSEIIDPVSKQVIGSIKKNEKEYFEQKIILPNGSICLLVEKGNAKQGCVKYDSLEETWVTMERPREMRMAVDSYKINAITLERDYEISLVVGLQRKFVMKRYLSRDNWCLQTEYDYERGTNNCIIFQELSEI